MLDTDLERRLHPNMRWVWVAGGGMATLVFTGLAAAAAAIVGVATDRSAP